MFSEMFCKQECLHIYNFERYRNYFPKTEASGSLKPVSSFIIMFQCFLASKAAFWETLRI